MNQEMMEKLIKDNLKIVYSVIHKHYPTFSRDEDVVASGKLGLCKAAYSWDEDKGIKFSTFAYKCVLNEIRMELRQRGKQPNLLSLDFEITGDDGESTSFGDFIVGESDVGYVDVETVYNQLPKLDQKIFNMKVCGLNNSEIARRVGYSRNTVDKHIRNIKQLLTEYEMGGVSE